MLARAAGLRRFVGTMTSGSFQEESGAAARVSGLLEKWQRSSDGRTILRDLDLVAVRVGAGQLELDDLAVLQVTESESTRACNEDVEHRPAQAEATRLSRETSDHFRPPPDLLERSLQQV